MAEGFNTEVMDCPTCSRIMELYALEFRYYSDSIEPRESFFCSECKSIWMMKDAQLTRAGIAEA